MEDHLLIREKCVKFHGMKLSTKEQEKLLETLKNRFLEHTDRHPRLTWPEIHEALLQKPEVLRTLKEMEDTGGEPDIVDLEPGSDRIFFCDCSKESPKNRRSVCYDQEALEARKKFPPKSSAKSLAESMNAKLLNEQLYRSLQEFGEFDLKTSSWLETPSDVRKEGGAIFGDRRYKRVFIYHNGADAYYSSRGFRVYVELPS